MLSRLSDFIPDDPFWCLVLVLVLCAGVVMLSSMVALWRGV